MQADLNPIWAHMSECTFSHFETNTSAATVQKLSQHIVEKAIYFCFVIKLYARLYKLANGKSSLTLQMQRSRPISR